MRKLDHSDVLQGRIHLNKQVVEVNPHMTHITSVISFFMYYITFPVRKSKSFLALSSLWQSAAIIVFDSFVHTQKPPISYFGNNKFVEFELFMIKWFSQTKKHPIMLIWKQEIGKKKFELFPPHFSLIPLHSKFSNSILHNGTPPSSVQFQARSPVGFDRLLFKNKHLMNACRNHIWVFFWLNLRCHDGQAINKCNKLNVALGWTQL
jgi:hypothetical protein